MTIVNYVSRAHCTAEKFLTQSKLIWEETQVVVGEKISNNEKRNKLKH